MFRLGTLAFVPGVVYRASAPDAEGTAGEGDIGRAAGGPRRAACMHEPDTHAQFDKFWSLMDKERRVFARGVRFLRGTAPRPSSLFHTVRPLVTPSSHFVPRFPRSKTQV